MSSGLIFSNCENCSSFAVLKSKFDISTFLVLPSTTIRGLASVRDEIDDEPRSRMVDPEPRSPELPMMSRPAIRPCKASSTEVIPKPSNSFIEIVCVEAAISRSGIGSELPCIRFFALTVTSFSTVAEFIVRLNVVLLIGNVRVFIPT